MKKIAIIGGGAAGMMAAATLLLESDNTQIDLFEKNTRLGVKVKISGGGRCNVTTGINNVKLLLKKYVRGERFVRSALSAFPPNKAREWFELHGAILKEESDQRVFPVSDDGSDIVAVFERIFRDPRITVHCNEAVVEIIKDDNFRLVTKEKSYMFDTLVITTGGNAYRRTGSTGDGYAFAKALGHTITKLGPSLNSFFAQEKWPKTISGISFPNSKLTSKLSTGVKISESGPILLTHFGITGPVVFALAAHSAFEQIEPNAPLKIFFVPNSNLVFDTFDKEIRLLLETQGAKLIRNIMTAYFPERFVVQLLKLAKIQSKNAADVTKKERQSMVKLITEGIPLTIVGRRPGDEFVTAGGISLNEVNPKLMQSKINPDLYFAGEVLDIDALTGGFNLQSAWATGRMAGIAIARDT